MNKFKINDRVKIKRIPSYEKLEGILGTVVSLQITSKGPPVYLVELDQPSKWCKLYLSEAGLEEASQSLTPEEWFNIKKIKATLDET